MDKMLTIIVPSFNNPQFLNPCVQSIAQTGVLDGLAELIIVNNGKQPMDVFKKFPSTRVLEPGRNLGWEGGLDLGLKNSSSPFVCFQNDDTYIPKANMNFYSQLMHPFKNSNVAAVGPATTNASGWHSIFMNSPLQGTTEVSFLIFFTVMLRRQYLEDAGGIDTTAPGGDDFDLSIRLRNIGRKIVINPLAFLIHHGFKTGERVRGAPDKPGGWNSVDMTDRTNQWLIQKHGFKTFIQTRMGLELINPGQAVDKEGDAIRALNLSGEIVELGCGFRKTIEKSLGIDRVAFGEKIPHVMGNSIADIQADVTKPLPLENLSKDVVIARHIIEHCIDSVETLRNWNRVLKLGGKLVISTPNEEIGKGIPMNPEHVVTFTPRSLKALVEVCGFKEVGVCDPENGVSFVGCYEKVEHVDAEVAHA